MELWTQGFPSGARAGSKRNPAVETAGCKPKPTAYEKYLVELFI